MKLSKTQEELLSYLKKEIDHARTNDFIDWLYINADGDKAYPDYITKDNILEHCANSLEHRRGIYEEYKSGIVLTMVSTNTLRALEKKGLIEIVLDGTGNILDKVKLLDY